MDESDCAGRLPYQSRDAVSLTDRFAPIVLKNSAVEAEGVR
jgi:hypothetical protein